MDQNNIWQQDVIDAILFNMEPGPRTIWDRNALLLNPGTKSYKQFVKQFQTCILRSLKFADINRRAQGVSNPYPETFEWIYRACSEDTSSDFVRFLKGDQNLFWITGKPASGKSTLMKMIGDDPRTIHYLETWSGGEGVFVSRFYFWNSGTQIQMSEEGFLRTLLYEALKQQPYLVPITFPDRMENFVLFGNGNFFDMPWDMPELLEAYKQLVLEIAKSKKIFILIDGLGEFYGDYSEQLKLVELLYSLLSLSPNVKICVSSRPWNIFADAFQTHPSLKLEDLT